MSPQEATKHWHNTPAYSTDSKTFLKLITMPMQSFPFILSYQLSFLSHEKHISIGGGLFFPSANSEDTTAAGISRKKTNILP